MRRYTGCRVPLPAPSRAGGRFLGRLWGPLTLLTFLMWVLRACMLISDAHSYEAMLQLGPWHSPRDILLCASLVSKARIPRAEEDQLTMCMAMAMAMATTTATSQASNVPLASYEMRPISEKKRKPAGIISLTHAISRCNTLQSASLLAHFCLAGRSAQSQEGHHQTE